jgi:putative transposase
LPVKAAEFFKHITLQRICWRRSFGSRRSLGWIPFQAASLRRNGKYLRFCGKTIRFFEAARLSMIARWHQGCFAQDAVGDWYLCLPVQLADQTPPPQKGEIGIDLGLKDIAVTSDADRLTAGHFYRSIEQKIAQAQRQGHRRQAARLHRKACRRRLDLRAGCARPR